MNTITEIHLNKTGKLSDKWDSYLSTYDQLFAHLKNTPVKLFEIGVQNGGSLETWDQYFVSAQLLLGCDINPACGQLQYSDPRVRVVIGNVNEYQTKKVIDNLASRFDIIIDDGSHRAEDIIASFLLYFDSLEPGGIYVIEDTHTAYFKEAGGGVNKVDNVYGFFKRLIDVINMEFWEKEQSVVDYMQALYPQMYIPVSILEGWINSIEFRNSMIIIRKCTAPIQSKLGPRRIAGNVAQVDSMPLHLKLLGL